MSTLREQTQSPLTQRVREVALAGEVTLPPLPETGYKLLRLLQDEDGVDSRKITQIVSTDPAIAATMLRVANSAYYGGLELVTTIGGAVARLGTRRVGSLVTTLIHKGQFEQSDRHKPQLLEVLWKHAVAAGLAARRLAAVAEGEEEEAYLAGLFHDIGKLLALKAVDHIAVKDPGTAFSPAIVEEILNATHAELGYRVLKDWKLPDPICEAVRVHHDPYEEIESVLALNIQAANALTKVIGAHLQPEPDLVLEDEPSIERLNLTDVELATLVVDMEAELNSLHGLF